MKTKYKCDRKKIIQEICKAKQKKYMIKLDNSRANLVFFILEGQSIGLEFSKKNKQTNIK